MEKLHSSHLERKKKASRDCRKMPSISCIFSDWIFQPGIQLWMKLLPLAAGWLTSLLWVSPGGDTVACHRGSPPTDLNKANQTVDYMSHTPVNLSNPTQAKYLYLVKVLWNWIISQFYFCPHANIQWLPDLELSHFSHKRKSNNILYEF